MKPSYLVSAGCFTAAIAAPVLSVEWPWRRALQERVHRLQVGCLCSLSSRRPQVTLPRAASWLRSP